MIEFRCGKCDGVVRAPEAHAGKKGRCPTCQEVVPIPEKSERLEPVEFPCEKCGHGMKAPGKFVGRQGKCAKCGHLMTIPPESVPHGDALPVAKPVAKPQVVAAKPQAVVQARPVQPAVAKPSHQAPAPNPFAQPQPAATNPVAAPNPFAQPQPKPAAQPNAFAQPQPAPKPQVARPALPVAAANDPFADLGNIGAPAMAPMPMGRAVPAYGAYAAPAPYGAPTHRPSGSSGDPAGIISMVLGIVSLLLMMGGCLIGCVLAPVGGAFHILAFFVSTGGLITGFFGKSGFRVAGIVMNAIVMFIVLMLFAIGIVLALTIGLSGVAAEGFGDPSYESDPWGESYDPYESDFDSDF